ncbi:hypothetical protein LUZ61_013253 [Rhynchospora tenuis]|uniref:Uncharacterized protein n=1 Tax=Rhynchospora tenuis TaxID=198213 RepID=A0AAD5W978_9POAL|nr:hypothetical protein LUZ61_013253 [Rhynchospora tenuis]
MAGWIWTVGGCVGSAIVQKLVEMGFSYLSKRTQPVDSEAALKRLETALPQIKAIMGVAEALKLKDPSTRNWVQQFRDAVDAADDVLDELEYKKLENMVQNRGDLVGEGSSSSSKKRKTEMISGDLLERLKKAVTMLDEVTAGMEDLLQRAKELGIHYLSESQFEVRTNLSRETTSFLSEAERKVFVREAEKAQIIGWLTRQTEAPLSSFGIVGLGGLGKTTLARCVYQELSRTHFFEKTIWVCVSTEFSVKVITKKILDLLGEEYNSDDSLEVLQQCLATKIHSKKVLLILDDVWEEKKWGEWEQLIAPLKCAHQGSQILFTTRQKSVVDLLASVISTKHESLALRDLEKQEMRLIFYCYAFHPFDPDKYGDLQAIGDEIVKKLHGSPLAARVIGSLLNSQLDLDFWRRISDNDSLINLEEANDVMKVLEVSYYNLPADLQVCFRFCSIFSEDHCFDKDELIKLWMASGFLGQQSWKHKRPEDIGEDYFNILLRKSFFEVSKEEEGYYIMHDLIHELATNVSEGECCRIGPNDKLPYIPSTVRHVSVHESEIQMVSHLENIRSLVITTCWKQDETDPNFFILSNNLVKKKLRLLKINANCCCKLQAEVSYLVHLRYLCIFHHGLFRQHIIHLPIYKLYHLLVLEVAGTEDSRIETTRMANLVSLRYMWLPDRSMKTIGEVHMMTSLQELKFFVGRESGHRVNELRTLNNLRVLTIFNVEDIRDPTEARSANLLEMKNLRSLKLVYTFNETNLDNPEKIFDNLQPHQNLMELEIKNYKGQRFPMWKRGDTPHLSTFKLHQCPNLNNQPSFGQMPPLKVLEIHECPNINILPDIPLSLIDFSLLRVGLTVLPRFSVGSSTQLSQTSSLRYVNITKCPNLIMLDGFLQQGTVDLHGLKELYIEYCENLEQIPMHAFMTCVSLKILSIRNCRKLTKLPDIPLSLTEFTVSDVGLTVLPRFSISSSTQLSQTSLLRYVNISACPNLIMLDGFLQQGTVDLHGLKELYIDNCENLAQIPMDAFRTCVSLKELSITNCRKLTKLPDIPLFLTEFTVSDVGLTVLPRFSVPSSTQLSQTSSLRHVNISACPNLIMLDGFLRQGTVDLHGLKELFIRYCENLEQIPMHAFMTCVSLKKLSITNCRKLTKLPDISLFLTEFTVSNVGLTVLPRFSVPSLTQLSQTSSLRYVNISACPNLIMLDGFLQQGTIDLHGLKELFIGYCENLEQIPMHAFMTCVSLKKLWLTNCRKLTKLPDIPLFLTEFTVWDVGLTVLPRFSVPSSTQLSQTSSLRYVNISACPNLIMLDGFLQQGTVDLHGLKELYIDNCENLAQIPMDAFRTCVSLKELSIRKCLKLTSLPCLPLSLVTFEIEGIGFSALPEYFESSTSGSSGGPSPPSSFTTSSLQRVSIVDCPNLIGLNGFFQQDNIEFWAIISFYVSNCENLVQIPKGAFSKFVSLDRLCIMDCPKLTAIDDNWNNLLPSKLRNLVMKNCGEFRCATAGVVIRSHDSHPS